ncbi:hypothetical protein HOY80DRAFT_292046 [Tuber brumale]|nr:hypothetical protein HOY80DRAFT_292046 [Tuber brumale]
MVYSGSLFAFPWMVEFLLSLQLPLLPLDDWRVLSSSSSSSSSSTSSRLTQYDTHNTSCNGFNWTIDGIKSTGCSLLDSQSHVTDHDTISRREVESLARFAPSRRYPLC